MNNGISKLPDYEVHLSSLDIFLVNNNSRFQMIPDGFIEGMKEVKVLDMNNCDITHLPQSMKLLTKLRMLNLTGNKSLHEISILGEMQDLEILLLKYTGITNIPQEIGRLVNLKRLEVSGCDYIHMAPGVISRLQRLEELCIDFNKMSEGVCDCIVEVMKLPYLTYLDLTVNSISLIPKDFNSENLKGFLIKIGGNDLQEPFLRTTSNHYSERYLYIHHDYLAIPKWLKRLIKVSRPITILKGILTLSNVMPALCAEGFNNLEHICLCWSPNISCLVDESKRCDRDEGKTKEKFFKELKLLSLIYLYKLEVLWKCPDEYIGLTKLVFLEIYFCNKLKRVFTTSVAQGLVNLKELEIKECGVLEEVIWCESEGGSDVIIVFPSLTTICFERSPSLKKFYSGNFSINYPSLVSVKISWCENMKIWGHQIHKTPILKTLHVNSHVQVLDGPCAINEALAKSYEALEEEKATSTP